jgi:hypothetical protein
MEQNTEYMDGYEEKGPIQIYEQELRNGSFPFTNVSAACICLIPHLNRSSLLPKQ